MARLVRGAGVVAAALAAQAALQVALALPLGYDLQAYWLAARHLLDGAPLYPAPLDRVGLSAEFRYPPIVAVPFVILTPFPFPVARVIYSGALVLLAAAIARSGIRPLPWAARPWAAAGVLFFLPLVLEVTLGNLNLVSLALCLAAWRWRDRAPLAGTMLAFGVGLKLLPAALVLFYLGARRWRILAWAAAVGAFALMVMVVALPAQTADYLRFAPRLLDQDWVVDVIDRPGPPWLAALFWSAAFPDLLAAAVAIGALAAGAAARAGGERATTLHHVTLATMGYLAPFGYFWTTFLVLALPLFGDALRRAFAIAGRRARSTAVAIVALAWALMLPQELHDLTPIAVHLAGTFVLVGLSLILLRRAGPRQSDGRSIPRSRANETASG